MEPISQKAVYSQFIQFVRAEVQKERSTTNRRMLSVFVWCFLAPAIVSVVMLLLIKAQLLPRSMRGYLDWMMLVFPVLYSVYVLSFEVLKQIPANMRRGTLSTLLAQSERDGLWRERICAELGRAVPASQEEWK